MDDRNPSPSSEIVTRVMRANKAKGTEPEISVRRMLCEMGHPGYRLNWKKIPGRPDIAYPGRKIAIFINGCFWHRCPNCNLPLPKSHMEFWQEKFERNVERDKRKTSELEGMGWTVITIWECEIKKDTIGVKARVSEVFQRMFNRSISCI